MVTEPIPIPNNDNHGSIDIGLQQISHLSNTDEDEGLEENADEKKEEEPTEIVANNQQYGITNINPILPSTMADEGAFLLTISLINGKKTFSSQESLNNLMLVNMVTTLLAMS